MVGLPRIFRIAGYDCKLGLSRMKKIKGEDYWASLKGFLTLTAIVIVIWLGNLIAMPLLYTASDGGTSSAGTAGDMFGGITALFSGLAFAGLVTTLFMQRKELELQRKELRQTREVFSVQRFENTFFGLIRLFNEHINSIEETYSSRSVRDGTNAKTVLKGRAALVLIATHLPKPNEDIIDGSDNFGEPIKKGNRTKPFDEMISEYESMFDKYLDSNLGPYFRLIYNILRHVENTKFSEDTSADERAKLVYSKILRAHLNSSEAKLLMFNCVSIHGRGLKKWVEKHSMLKHITRDQYKANKVIVDVYEPVAFRFHERPTNHKK